MLQYILLLQQPVDKEVQETTKRVFSATESAQSTLIDLVNGFFAQLPVIAVGAFVFLIFLGISYLGRRLINTAASKANLDPMLAYLMARTGRILIIIVGLFVSATVVFPGITLGDLVAGLGIGSVALSFAFRDILQNLFSGFLILLYRPFLLGDQIKVNDFEGVVEEISIRSTLIKTFDGERVIIPNSKVYMESVLVRTAFPQRRTKIVVGIGYQENIDEARRILMDILNNTEGVLNDPAPDVDIVELADSSVNLRMLFWTKSKQSDTRNVSSEITQAVKNAFDKAAIDIPFPHLVVDMVNTNQLPQDS